jgi:acyl-CoA dehydrogenase
MGHEVADILIQPSAARSRLIAGMYLPKSDTDLIGKLEAAMHAVIAAEPIEAKVRAAKKAGRLSGHGADAQYEEAMKLSVITETELALWKRARLLQHEIIMVDDFDKQFGKHASSAPEVWQQAEAAE